MKSRTLLNIAMFVLVIVLGYFVFGEDNEADSHQLSNLVAEDINSIEIRHRDRYVVLKKLGEHWHMVKPINIAANDFRVGILLKFINTVTHASYHVTEVDLSRFKLNNPVTSIRFSDKNDDMLFEFGTANPINRLRYVKTGESIHLIDDNFYPLVSSQLGTLISHSLLPEIDTITALHLPDIQLDHPADADWQITPTDSSLSADDINTVIDEWKNAQAFGVHNYLEREQLGSITAIYNYSGIRHIAQFVITDIDPWLIIARPELDIEYHFGNDSYDRLMRPGYKQDQLILDAEEAKINES